MKCQKCGGKGKILISAYKVKCPRCNGTGEIDAPTQEQWFCLLSTEDKAKWLDGLIAYCFGIGHITETEQKKYQHIVADVEAWLKESHM